MKALIDHKIEDNKYIIFKTKRYEGLNDCKYMYDYMNIECYPERINSLRYDIEFSILCSEKEMKEFVKWYKDIYCNSNRDLIVFESNAELNVVSDGLERKYILSRVYPTEIDEDGFVVKFRASYIEQKEI